MGMLDGLTNMFKMHDDDDFDDDYEDYDDDFDEDYEDSPARRRQRIMPQVCRPRKRGMYGTYYTAL